VNFLCLQRKIRRAMDNKKKLLSAEAEAREAKTRRKGESFILRRALTN
jgi:hypothetical protein